MLSVVLRHIQLDSFSQQVAALSLFCSSDAYRKCHMPSILIVKTVSKLLSALEEAAL